MAAHPDKILDELLNTHGLSHEKASIIDFDYALSSFFNEVYTIAPYSKIISNILTGQVKTYQKKKNLKFDELGINPPKLALLVKFNCQGRIRLILNYIDRVYPDSKKNKNGKIPKQIPYTIGAPAILGLSLGGGVFYYHLHRWP